MRETETKEIDGCTYTCTMMSVRQANRTWIELCAVLGEPVVRGLARASADADQQVQDLIMAAISAALRNLSEEVHERLVEAVFDGVRADGVGELKAWEPKFESQFRGRLLTMYKVWAWSVQVNYQDFLDAAQSLGLGEVVSLGKEAIGKAQESLDPQTSTGESGESSPASTTTSH